MKKTTVGVTILIMAVLVGVVGCYAYFSGKARQTAEDAALSAVQLVLSRDLQNDYPATVKEVLKYYTEIEKCFYNEEYTDEELEALAAAADEFDQAIETGDANVIAKADEQFHEIIISATGNDKLIELLNSFLKQIYRYRAAYVKHESVYGELKAEHRKILKGLEQGDVDMTMEAMFVHIDRQQKFMQEWCADRAKK